uniref:Uncharacterized protein n=1 Tax=Salix viminalis TaxID=40686 RepID=A0A6N2L431_SALVM
MDPGLDSGRVNMILGPRLYILLSFYMTKAGIFVSSPTSILTSPPVSPPSDSPPLSPVSPQVIGGSGSGSFTSMSALLASMRGLQVGKTKMGSPVGSWSVQSGSRFGSPRGSSLRPVSAACLQLLLEQCQAGLDLLNFNFALGLKLSVSVPECYPDFLSRVGSETGVSDVSCMELRRRYKTRIQIQILCSPSPVPAL